MAFPTCSTYTLQGESRTALRSAKICGFFFNQGHFETFRNSAIGTVCRICYWNCTSLNQVWPSDRTRAGPSRESEGLACLLNSWLNFWFCRIGVVELSFRVKAHTITTNSCWSYKPSQAPSSRRLLAVPFIAKAPKTMLVLGCHGPIESPEFGSRTSQALLRSLRNRMYWLASQCQGPMKCFRILHSPTCLQTELRTKPLWGWHTDTRACACRTQWPCCTTCRWSQDESEPQKPSDLIHLMGQNPGARVNTQLKPRRMIIPSHWTGSEACSHFALRNLVLGVLAQLVCSSRDGRLGRKKSSTALDERSSHVDIFDHPLFRRLAPSATKRRVQNPQWEARAK